MRRFEQSTPQGTRFWEAELVGSALTLRSGKVGSRAFPEEREERYRSPAEARLELERLIKSRLNAGWRELRPKSDIDEHEAALAVGDEAQWLVFADRLQAAGDIRGEFIALLHRLGSKRTAQREIDAFVERHEHELLGSLAPHREQFDFTWKYGYLQDVSVGCLAEAEAHEEPIDGLLRPLLALESARFMRSLKLGWPETGPEVSYQAAVDEAVAAPWPKYLNDLTVGDFGDSSSPADDWAGETDRWPDLRSLASLTPKLRQVERLEVKANLRQFGLAELPNTRALELRVAHAEPELVRGLLAAKAPKLESLVLDFPASTAIDLDTLDPILEGTAFRALTQFGLNGFDSEVLGSVAQWPVLKRLKKLDLSANSLDDSDVERLCQLKSRFAHLDMLVLRRNFFTNEGAAELARVLGKVELAESRAPRTAVPERFDDVME